LKKSLIFEDFAENYRLVSLKLFNQPKKHVVGMSYVDLVLRHKNKR
jgi:hypothetical protein